MTDELPGDVGGLLAGLSGGSRVAGYQLEEQIGAGGMAIVFRARDEMLGRAVALGGGLGLLYHALTGAGALALLAGVGARVYTSVQESAREAIQMRECLYPRAANKAVYDRLYEVYRNLYPAVREMAHRLSALATEAAPGGLPG